MILILADAHDADALWLRAALAPLVAMPLAVLTPARLVYARTIMHHMDSSSTHSCFDFGDGTSLDTSAIRGVVNRMSGAPTDHFSSAEPRERLYAASELQAFLLGWLASLPCPLLNPPAPESLAGAWHSDVVATQLAVLAGLRCRPFVVDADDPPLSSFTGMGSAHFILDGKVIGPMLPARDRDALIQFAHLWGARLVQVETCQEQGRLTFLGASSLPHYPRGGPTLVRAMAQVLAT
jgi:hypothetical protein